MKELFGLVVPSDIQILAGVNKLDDKNGILYEVDKIIKHEHYTTDKFKNEVADIALIRLAEDIVFNDKIQPVRLASSENQEDVLPVGAPVMITGWGYTRECMENHEEEVNDLRVAIRTISNFDECQFEYSEKRKNTTEESDKPFAIDSGMICSIGFQYSCMGDSGGPIVDGRGVQVGIVSFSQDSLPDVHTSVRFYSEWIANNSKIAEN
ncbi:chymotrypsin-2-like [Trichogramma pretiosum]|uniref:chymotrypsin-2-like n=1 Tax=Trichogramma pretiosum TaxID=7493 RepID=UPI0006C96899|nr:chymotrypsin-2-like [Trichogramma pretiosum]